MDHAPKHAETRVIQPGRELDLLIAKCISKGLIAATIVAIVAAVLMFQDGVSTRTEILISGAVLSVLALFGFAAVIVREAYGGGVKRGLVPVLVGLGGFVPYCFGCYLVFYEGLWGLVRLLGSFTFGSFFAAVLYVIFGYSIVAAIYRISEFGRALDDGRITIKNNAATQP